MGESDVPVFKSGRPAMPQLAPRLRCTKFANHLKISIRLHSNIRNRLNSCSINNALSTARSIQRQKMQQL
jgi:hypothetical protein